MTAPADVHANAPIAGEALEDRELVSRILGGEQAAFATLMRRYNRRLFRLARATLHDDADAEDALQDAYLQAFRSLGQFRGDAALSTWLSRLVLNACYARLRREARRQNIVPIAGACEEDVMPDAIASPQRDAMRAEMRALLERKLDALPEDFRIVFVLRSVEELSAEEVAACLDIPQATVRSRHFRARALLREALACEIEFAERDVYEFGGKRCDRVVAEVMARIDRNV